MAQKKLYEFALVHHPKQTKDAQGNDTSAPDSIITVPDATGTAQEVTRILAIDDMQATRAATRAIPADYADKMEEVEIRVRPF